MQTTWPLRRSRSFKVIDFGTNWKLVCDFLFVINTNLLPALHCFQVMADYLSNFRYQHGSASLRPHWGWSPANIRINFTSSETRRIVLSGAEDCTIVCSFVWRKHWNVTDGQINGHWGQTNRWTESLRQEQRSALQIMQTHCNKWHKVKRVPHWKARGSSRTSHHPNS